MHGLDKLVSLYTPYESLAMRHYGHCEYCGEYGRMTKEHVVPRCYGGLVKIWACSTCNNQRGHSGNHPLFLNWLGEHEARFKEAVEQSRDRKQTDTWLNLNGLDIYKVVHC